MPGYKFPGYQEIAEIFEEDYQERRKIWGDDWNEPLRNRVYMIGDALLPYLAAALRFAHENGAPNPELEQ